MKILRGNRANYAPTASSPVIAHVCAEKGSRCARCEVRAKFESTSSVLAESCNVLASDEQKRLDNKSAIATWLFAIPTDVFCCTSWSLLPLAIPVFEALARQLQDEAHESLTFRIVLLLVA